TCQGTFLTLARLPITIHPAPEVPLPGAGNHPQRTSPDRARLPLRPPALVPSSARCPAREPESHEESLMRRNLLPLKKPTAGVAACLALTGGLLLAEPARAQVIIGNNLPSPRLSSVTPAGGKAGTTVEVTFTGTDLENPDALLFSHPGIKATPFVPPPPPPPKPDPKKPAPPAKPAPPPPVTKFTVTIAADVPLGYHDVRLVNKWGVSNPRVFVV